MLTVAQRLKWFFWLSWRWGMLVAVLVGLGFIAFRYQSHYHPERLNSLLNEASGVSQVVILSGAGALLGNVLRQRLMRYLLHRAEATPSNTARVAWLIGGTLLLFVDSVVFCQIIFMLLNYGRGIVSMTLPLLRLFFILSAPWLFTAPLAAYWVCRDLFQPQRS